MVDPFAKLLVVIRDGATNRTTFEPNVCRTLALISRAIQLFPVPPPLCKKTKGAIGIADESQVVSNLTYFVILLMISS